MPHDQDAAGVDAPAAEGCATLRWVAIYLVTREYGGPEEGGWYFDAGELVTDVEIYQKAGATPAAFLPGDEACEVLRQKMFAACEQMNFGRRPLHSVISTGVFQVDVVDADVLPAFFPAERPVWS